MTLKTGSSTALLIVMAFLGACTNLNGGDIVGSDGAVPTHYIIESVMSDAGQIASASEDLIGPQGTGSGTCAYSTARGACFESDEDFGNGTVTVSDSMLNWDSCKVGDSLLSGGWKERWDPIFCPAGTRPPTAGNDFSFSRSSSSQILSLKSGASILTNTNTHKTYTGTEIPSGDYTGISLQNIAGTKTLKIFALRKIMTAQFGAKWFDYSVTTPTSMQITGSLETANRIVDGDVTVYNNYEKYTALHTFNAVTWGSSTCCYPTSGSIESHLTGSKSGTLQMDFTADCGVADFTDALGTVTTVNLVMCN